MSKGKPRQEKKEPCPACGQPKSTRSSLCRKCASPYQRTPEHRERMSKALAGRERPQMRGRKRPEHSRYMKEVYWTPERREAARIRGEILAENREWIMQIAHALTGENNPNYQGKDNASGYAPGWGRAYRKRLIARANGVCEECHKPKAKLEPHHRDFSKTNHEESNILVVCRSCHKLLHAANSRKT